MDEGERQRLERQEKGDRRFMVVLFGFLAGIFVLGLIAIAYVVGYSNGKDEGRKVQPAAAQASTTETQPGTTGAAQTGTAGAGKGLTITMGDYSFTPSAVTTNAGPVTITTPNDGQVEHELVLLKTDRSPASLPVKGNEVDEEGLEAKGVETPGEIEEVGPGQTKTGSFKLTPGSYVMICNLPGHFQKGMYGSLTVQ
jgi:uncharacterized cupredoxin-like copper-binding protein